MSVPVNPLSTKATIAKQHRITIPPMFRRNLGFKEGAKVEIFATTDGGLLIELREEEEEASA